MITRNHKKADYYMFYFSQLSSNFQARLLRHPFVRLLRKRSLDSWALDLYSRTTAKILSRIVYPELTLVGFTITKRTPIA